MFDITNVSKFLLEEYGSDTLNNITTVTKFLLEEYSSETTEKNRWKE